MKIWTLTLILAVLFISHSHAQIPRQNVRSLLSVMVVPYTFGNEDVLLRLERDTGYKNAISVINSALIDMGYSKTLDFKTYKDNIDNKIGFAGEKAWADKINFYIENAPVDIIIETEITWTDPPGEPRNRRAKLRLKAIDKYTSAIYADNGSVQSAEREFPDLGTAVESALTRDGRMQFKRFLDQLDQSYLNLMANGRQISVRFNISNENANLRFSDMVRNEKLSDKIEEYIHDKAYLRQYELVGESPSYMNFNMIIPVIDSLGVPQTPSWFLSKGMNNCFQDWGLDVQQSIKRSWMIFTLLKRAH